MPLDTLCRWLRSYGETTPCPCQRPQVDRQMLCYAALMKGAVTDRDMSSHTHTTHCILSFLSTFAQAQDQINSCFWQRVTAHPLEALIGLHSSPKDGAEALRRALKVAPNDSSDGAACWNLCAKPALKHSIPIHLSLRPSWNQKLVTSITSEMSMSSLTYLETSIRLVEASLRGHDGDFHKSLKTLFTCALYSKIF